MAQRCACFCRDKSTGAAAARDGRANSLRRLGRRRLAPLAFAWHTRHMIAIGDRLPEATLMETTEFGEACPLSPKPVNTVEAAKGKRIVLFGVPGAYTPTCSAKHVPGYVANLDAFKACGVDEIWCVSV